MKKILVVIFLFFLVCVTVVSDSGILLRVEKGEYLTEITNPYDWELIVIMDLVTDSKTLQKEYNPGVHPFPGDIYGEFTLPEWEQDGMEYIRVCWRNVHTKERFCGIVNGVPSTDDQYLIGGSYKLYLPSVYLESTQ